MIDSKTLLNRFLTYVKVDSQSNPNSESTPSTEKQWTIAHLLKEELERIGLQDVSIDDKAYIMATLPSNVDHEVPTIGFVSHFDTSPDFKASGIKPQIHENYDGGDIMLNAEKNIILSPDYFEDLKLYEGQTLITTDGTTLLSADDKAGITEIIMAMEYLVDHPEIKHGKIRVGLTPWTEVKLANWNTKTLMLHLLSSSLRG
jgi:tripeptide aminopeptidase